MAKAAKCCSRCAAPIELNEVTWHVTEPGAPSSTLCSACGNEWRVARSCELARAFQEFLASPPTQEVIRG